MKYDTRFNSNYCFLDDNPDYFKDYWDNNLCMGSSAWDPDSKSFTLQQYNMILWSKRLPNGEYMNLLLGNDGELLWKGNRYSSDSIIVSFKYRDYKYMMDKVMATLPDYKTFFEDYSRKAYTIGGEVIFPKRRMGMNQSRGFNRQIRDRFDLTLECIRRYYLGLENPLQTVMEHDKEFFDMFGDFKGYVDFFYLQDIVNEDYSDIHFFKEFTEFDGNVFPESPEEYLAFINKELEFVEKRNARIADVFKLETR
ncbi:MAG: hypothetical protein IJI42_11815 [Methanobrevibacter sp.]|nr:hypothetical protein [Methanobrevibacter sp.]